MISVAINTVALLLYVVAGVLYGASLALRAPTNAARARVLLTLGVVIHTAGIGAFCITVHQSPFSSFYGTLSIAAWAIAVLYLPMEFLAHVPAVGALAAPVASIMLFAAMLHSRSGLVMSPVVRSKIISLHVLMILLSFALFALAACCAVFYIWQYGALKHPDRRALFRRLPPLETVDRTAYHLVAFALPLLTIGLALGMVRATEGALRGNWVLDPHTLISIAAWLVYGGYLVARTVGGWRGTRPNYLLIAGLAVTLALYIVPATTHRFT